MPVGTVAFVCAGDRGWVSEISDISASRSMILRPAEWRGRIGDCFAVDMLFGGGFDVHVKARLSRVEGRQLGFSFVEIADDHQAALWDVLGRYADAWEA